MLIPRIEMNMKHSSIALLWIFIKCVSGWSILSTTFPPSTDSTGYYYVNSNSSFGNVSCSDGEAAFPSLTYVVDTTGSMSQLQEITRNLVNSLSVSYDNVTRQYTLMEFNDPSVGPLRATCSADDFVNYINYLSTSYGGDCPELAMAGLLTALENSPSGSLVVLVTDASAKDSNDPYTVERIFSLLESKQVKVFILGANPCGSTSDYDFQVYKDIASRSYGHVFQNIYTSAKIADFLNFFLQIPLNSTTQLLSVDYNYYYYYYYYNYYNTNFQVSTNFSAIIISTTCSSCSIYIYNSYGNWADTKSILSESWGSLFYVENPSYGLWTMQIYGPGSYSIRVLGFKANSTSNVNTSSICSQCDINASCRKHVFSHTCVCNEGFSGDGYSCYDIDECTYYYYYYTCNNGYCINTYGSYNCACSSGFISENKTCVDVDECSRPELNSCHAFATCYNNYGSYSCACQAGYYGNGYYCEVDECTKEVCGFARECIKSNGSHSCLDPCNSYTTLNEPTRSTSYSAYPYYYYYYYYYGRSDYYLNGWYRFVGSGGIRMAESCPSEGHCYTRSPMWLNGTHPNPTDGIVNRTACAVYSGNCCYLTSNVQIKACPGDYHIYKFSGTTEYYAGYCTDPATVADSCSCADNEECKLVGGRYSCYCKSSANHTALEDLTPELTCGNQEIKASLQKCSLQRFNLNTNSVHLRDKSCTGFSDFNNTNLITVVSVLKNGVCGNQLVNNKTHVTYKNTIYISMDSIGGKDIVSIDYSCVYPLDMQLSIETAVMMFSSSIDVSVEGTGHLLVTMAFYQDSSYRTPYEGSEILLTSKTILYIGIILTSGDSTQYSILMKNCYATASKNASSSAKYDIIKNSCPSQQDSTINVIANGNSQNGQFSVQLFGYVKDSNVVYLHCDIHICDKTSETCTPSCTGMRALSTDISATENSLTLGPVIKQADLSTNPIQNGATSLMAHMSTAVLFLTGNLLFIIFSY